MDSSMTKYYGGRCMITEVSLSYLVLNTAIFKAKKCDPGLNYAEQVDHRAKKEQTEGHVQEPTWRCVQIYHFMVAVPEWHQLSVVYSGF